MKKILACLAIICCLTMVLGLPASAASAKDVDVIVNVKNEEVTVSINTNFACGGVQGVLKYDSEKIAYKDITVTNAIVKNNTADTTVSSSAGQTKVALVGDVSNGTTGEWAEIAYSVNDNEPVKFDFSSLKAFDKSGKKISDANIYIVMRGDANSDGMFNLIDLVRMKKVAAGASTIQEKYKKNFDMDNNGAWEPAADITAFAKYLLNAF